MCVCSCQQLVLASWLITVHLWKYWISISVLMWMIMPSKMCYRYVQELLDYLIHVRMYIHTYIRMYIYTYVCIYVDQHEIFTVPQAYVMMYICMYVYTSVVLLCYPLDTCCPFTYIRTPGIDQIDCIFHNTL